MLTLSPTPTTTERLLDDTDIATLPDRTVHSMTREELITLVRSSPVAPPQPDIKNHIDLYDKSTLRRLAFLVRRCCQKRLARDAQQTATNEFTTP